MNTKKSPFTLTNPLGSSSNKKFFCLQCPRDGCDGSASVVEPVPGQAHARLCVCQMDTNHYWYFCKECAEDDPRVWVQKRSLNRHTRLHHASNQEESALSACGIEDATKVCHGQVLGRSFWKVGKEFLFGIQVCPHDGPQHEHDHDHAQSEERELNEYLIENAQTRQGYGNPNE